MTDLLLVIVMLGVLVSEEIVITIVVRFGISDEVVELVKPLVVSMTLVELVELVALVEDDGSPVEGEMIEDEDTPVDSEI
jgi:hypothetical protein